MDDPQKDRSQAESEPVIKPADQVDPVPPDPAREGASIERVDNVVYGAPLLANEPLVEVADDETAEEGTPDPRGY